MHSPFVVMLGHAASAPHIHPETLAAWAAALVLTALVATRQRWLSRS